MSTAKSRTPKAPGFFPSTSRPAAHAATLASASSAASADAITSGLGRSPGPSGSSWARTAALRSSARA